MNETLREKQKAEASARLKLMGVSENVLSKFDADGTVMRCVGGHYRPLTETEKEKVRWFEHEFDASVFLSVFMSTFLGDLDALLFVGKYDEEWEMEREDIQDGYAMSYCFNRDYPECSEMGSITFRTTEDGGIVRVG